MIFLANSGESVTFDLLCEGLRELFDTETLSSPPDGNHIVVTNQVELTGDPRVIFFTDKVIDDPSPEWLTPSLYLANRMRCRVQYPFIKPSVKFKKSGIVSSDEQLTVEKVAGALVYVHRSEDDYSPWLAVAGAFGTTVVTTDSDRTREFVNPQTILIPDLSAPRHWEMAVKQAIRNAERNIMAIENNGKKWSNLDVLAQKIKAKQEKKEIVKRITRGVADSSNPGEIARQERINRALSKKTVAKHLTRTLEPKAMVFTRKEYVNPLVSEVAVPPWFSSKNWDIDVSVIVPMFRSFQEVGEQIRNWDLGDGINHEVIYLDDSCPQNSKGAVVPAWEVIRNMFASNGADRTFNFPKKIGRVFHLSQNSGYATACNVGAEVASGKVLVFLNADTVPTQYWLRNIVKNIDKAGIIGNLQLKSNGTVDSAGSEWMKDSRSFDHIGRNVYQKKRLPKPFLHSSLPEDLTVFSPREMVTGCCFAIKKSLFQEVGGFDIGYRIGYWEDSDLNMKVREAGHGVYLEPSSVIYHKCGHSHAGHHPYMTENANLFYDKWLRNGKLEKLLGQI